jgi:uncharacterized protein with GYD domain
MTENPQDGATQVARLYEAYGGKMESIYFFSMGGEYDGLSVGQFPNNGAVAALVLSVGSSREFARSQALPLMSRDEFKGALEKVKGTAVGGAGPQ